MRFSELAGKELISIDEGARIGVVSESDLVIDTKTGTIDSIIIPNRGTLFRRRHLVVKWSDIKKIGYDLIIVDLSKMDEAASSLATSLSRHEYPQEE